MYKIFHGFHLVEAYQDLKKAKRLAKNRTVTRCIKLTVAITLSLILWFLPIGTFGIEGLTVIEQRLISIFIFATLMWVFEAIPAWTTSVLIVVLLLLTVSDSSLWFLTQNISADELGDETALQKFKDGNDPDFYPNSDWLGTLLSENGLFNNHHLSIKGGDTG